MKPRRRNLPVDDRGRVSLVKLGFQKGEMVVAEPVEGENLAWILRPGRVVTDVELEVLSSPANVESLVRAAQESTGGDNTIELS